MPMVLRFLCAIIRKEKRVLSGPPVLGMALLLMALPLGLGHAASTTLAPNGVDDTAAVKAALALGTVQLPPGAWHFCGLHIASDNTLTGFRSSIVYPTATCAATYLIGSQDPNVHNVTIEGFTIYGGSGNGSSLIDGIHFDNTGYTTNRGHIHIRDMEITGLSGTCLYMNMTDESIIADNNIEHCGVNAGFISSPDSQISDNSFGASGQEALLIHGGGPMNFGPTKVWMAGLGSANYAGVRCVWNCAGLQFSALETQDNGGPGLLIEGSTAAVVHMRSDSDNGSGQAVAAVVLQSTTNSAINVNASHREGGRGSVPMAVSRDEASTGNAIHSTGAIK